MALAKPLVTEFDIHLRLESCVLLSFHDASYLVDFVFMSIVIFRKSSFGASFLSTLFAVALLMPYVILLPSSFKRYSAYFMLPGPQGLFPFAMCYINFYNLKPFLKDPLHLFSKRSWSGIFYSISSRLF